MLLQYFSLVFLLTCVENSKILCLLPVPMYSHFYQGFTLCKELALRNHKVTVISPYPQKQTIKNYQDISIEESLDLISDTKKDLFDKDKLNAFGTVNFVLNMGLSMTEPLFNSEKVKLFMKSNQTFDLILAEHFFNDAHVGFGQYFNAPVVLFAPMAASEMTNYIFANPAPSSYVPNNLGTLSSHMSFTERIENFLLKLFGCFIREFVILPQQRAMFKKYFRDDLELDDVLYNVSLMLTNSHVSVHDPIPHVPGIIDIGGFHVNPPKKLPQDLLSFLDNSEHGAVLFSMGSNLRSSDLEPSILAGILRTFSQLKQNVLWKFEADLPNVPDNVRIMKWLPQQDILAHPKIVAFISHGGLLSTIETIFHGVPIIGIPVFGDQKSNMATAVQNGYAINIPLAELSVETLGRALKEILENPRYKKEAQRRSKIMHDRPMQPLDLAIFWIEFVLRHRGAPFLKTAGIQLKWYEREMVDVMIFIAFTFASPFLVFIVIIRK